MISRRAVLGGGLASLGALLLPGCAERADVLDAGRRAGYLRLGIAGEEPFGFMLDDGTPSGQAVAVGRAVLADLGVPAVEAVVTDFVGLIPGLLAGAFDVVAAGMTLTKERCAQVLFSDPVFCAQQGFAVRGDDPREIGSYEDLLATPEVRVAVLAGSVEESDVVALGLPPEQVLALPDPPSMQAALRGGTVDVVALTSIGVRWMSRDPASGLRVAGTFSPDGAELRCGGFAFRPGDRALAAPFGRVLHRLQREGTLAELSAPYGFTDEEIDAAVGLTARDVCG